MPFTTSKEVRLSKIIDPVDGKAVVVAADHGMMLGPVKGVLNLEATLKNVVKGSPDAILLSFGQASRLNYIFQMENKISFIVRADWTNYGRLGARPVPASQVKHKMMVRPRSALVLGASAILTYFFIGYENDEEEAEHFEKIAKIARECDKLNLPLIVEPIPTGPKLTSTNIIDLIAISVRMVIEAGADAIKAPYFLSGLPPNENPYRKVVKAASGVPVLILGGAKMANERKILELLDEALKIDISGVVFGRNIIQSADPVHILRIIRRMVHEGASIDEVLS